MRFLLDWLVLSLFLLVFCCGSGLAFLGFPDNEVVFFFPISLKICPPSLIKSLLISEKILNIILYRCLLWRLPSNAGVVPLPAWTSGKPPRIK